MADIYKPKDSGSPLGKIVGITVGALTGDPAAIAGSMMPDGSAAGKAMGAANKINGAVGKTGAATPAPDADPGADPEAAPQPASAMDRRMAQAQDSHPVIFHNALTALLDPATEMDPDIRKSAFEAIARAKYNQGPRMDIEG